ncbi:uncharacterized protein [Apostichopus japonicus]|uniref:uncharacterized protein isoform X2 n=1 Tax=Stichopus japonicus TaxID=307972 RepID=UPI003AB32F45
MSGMVGENSRKSAPQKGRTTSKREGDSTRISLMTAYSEWTEQKKKIEAFLCHTRIVTGANKKDFRTTMSHSQFAWHLLSSHKAMCASCRSFVYHGETLNQETVLDTSSFVAVKAVCNASCQTEESSTSLNISWSVPSDPGARRVEAPMKASLTEEDTGSLHLSAHNDCTVHCIGGLEVEEDDSDSIQVVSVQRGSQMDPEFVAQDNSMQESRIEGVTGVDRWIKQEEEDDPGEEVCQDVLITLQVESVEGATAGEMMDEEGITDTEIGYRSKLK